MIAEARGLGKDYRDLSAVEAIDLDINEGEIVGLLGPNGAGKTTTISMIAGVLAPTRGEVCIGGHDLANSPFEARRALGLVPQDLALYAELSGLENLQFFASLYDVNKNDRAARIDWALDLVGLRERSRDRVSNYSGGMKRRLNLAAGLIHRPAFLILDEPTVGVDPQSRKHIFDSILRLRQDANMSVLYTSHYMEEVEALCDRVVVMDHGRVIAEGAVDELVSQHAACVLVIELAKSADSNAAYRVAAEILGEDNASQNDGHLELVASGDFGPLLSAIENKAGAIVSLRTREPNLESVFLGLTGHSLRDGASTTKPAGSRFFGRGRSRDQ